MINRLMVRSSPKFLVPQFQRCLRCAANRKGFVATAPVPPFEFSIATHELRSPRRQGEIVGAAFFTFFVKGADFSRSNQLQYDTDGNLAMILDATSHSDIFADHAFGQW
jgi:hypothetical protein